VISFARPDREYEALRAPIDEAVSRVLRSGQSILGPEVERFEWALAAFAGVRFALGVSSGTDALVCALLGLGVGPGDEVLLGAFGFVAAPEAVIRVGARPVFVDVTRDALALDWPGLAEARTARTRAVISVDLFGVVQDLGPVRRAVPGLPIVEDAAQALGSALGAKTAGAHGDIGVFSFFPTKALGAAGDAGACITSDPELAARVAKVRVHGASAEYAWELRGGNYRLDAIQAAILSVKLLDLPRRLERRRAIGRHLAEAARRHGAVPIVGLEASSTAFGPLALRVEASRRPRVLGALRDRGVDARVHYPQALSDAPAFAAYADRRAGGFPEAVRATRELVSVPCHPELTDEEVDLVEDALRAALGAP
jgi:dTDP-4-amino-4,6-dideoxygalactose transaminase